jgi:hypothetical protein
VLGLTQLIAWGTLYYTPVLMMPRIAAAHGWSASFAMGGFSAGLFAGGIVAPTVGRMIDRFGGHVVMTLGSLAGAAGLVALTVVEQPFAYILVWLVLGAAMAANLYDPAFASLGRIFGAAARRPITLLTFIGGFASTVSWPVTHLLLGTLDWRGTYLVYAGLLALVAAPLHAFALPRAAAERDTPAADASAPAPPVRLPPHGLPFVLVATGFAAYAFIPSGLSAHLLAIFARGGIDPATVVLIGMLFGPSQVTSRLAEFMFGAKAHPLFIARFAFALVLCAFALLTLAGISTPLAAAFAIMFGVSNGLVTIARGTVPLALFGAAGYGRLIGRIAAPWLVMQAMAPLVLAFVAERASDRAALVFAGCFALIALVSFLLLRRPSR